MSDERGKPDYQMATVVMWLASGIPVLRMAGCSYETLERCRLIADELYKAINYRGARAGEIVEAIRKVREHGSILDDLPNAPTVRAKPPRPGG